MIGCASPSRFIILLIECFSHPVVFIIIDLSRSQSKGLKASLPRPVGWMTCTEILKSIAKRSSPLGVSESE